MVPRELSRAVTSAPATTAPEASVMVPVIFALMSCPCANEQIKNMKKLNSAMRAFIGGLRFPLIPKLFELREICFGDFVAPVLFARLYRTLIVMYLAGGFRSVRPRLVLLHSSIK